MTPATQAQVFARVINQDPAHNARGDGEELLPIHPLGANLILQFQVCLMDQCGRRERVADRLGTKLLVGDAAELDIHQGKQAVPGFRCTALKHGERGFDLLLFRVAHVRHL